MNFNVIPTDFFLEQVSKLSEQEKRIVKEKIELIKLNPYRFKRIHSKRFKRVFRVWVNAFRQTSRMIYVVLEPKIIIACIIPRDKDYKDLEKYLAKIVL